MIACEVPKTEFESEQAKYVHELSWLLKADPDRDFEKAISNSDYRFKGIHGYSISVPRVKVSCLDLDSDVAPISGTTDAVLGYEHAKLIAIAREYANYYNLRMYEYRAKNFGFECNS